MFGLVNSDSMEPLVYEEFDRLERAVSGYLLTEHDEEGAHNMEPVGLGFVPIGAIVAWSTATAPSAWHLCDGGTLSRTRFAALYALLGVSYGVGDGVTTFTLPTMAGPGAPAAIAYIIFTGLGT